jgi:hypothetical protein
MRPAKTAAKPNLPLVAPSIKIEQLHEAAVCPGAFKA